MIEIEAVSGHFTDSTVSCKKMIFDGTNNTHQGLFDDRGQVATVEISIGHEDPSTVEYDCSINYDDQKLDRATVKLTKSYIVSGQMHYTAAIGAQSVGTLLLDEGSVLSTDGAIIDVSVNELISLGGKIVTYPEERIDSTQNNMPGASGGILNFKINDGFGHLTVELRGLNGGKQTRVPLKNNLVPERNPELDGKCSGNHSRNDQRCWGKQGQTGFQGLQGFQGYPGGDTGILNLQIPDKNSFQITVLHFPGKGSEGGQGGLGGEGGPGGRGALIEWNEPNETGGCRSPRCIEGNDKNIKARNRYQFPHGNPGERGERGIKGIEGIEGKIIGSELLFNKEQLRLFLTFDWQNFGDVL